MKSNILEQLQNANLSKQVVELCRDEIEGHDFLGYIHGIGDEYLLMHVIDGEIRPNGFSCLRISDIKKCELPYRYSSFVESALELQGHTLTNLPEVDLNSAKNILTSIESMKSTVPLVTLHYEYIDPDICVIGRIADIGENELQLIHINPDASWDIQPTAQTLENITRIDFLHGYEEALYLVATSGCT